MIVHSESACEITRETTRAFHRIRHSQQPERAVRTAYARNQQAGRASSADLSASQAQPRGLLLFRSRGSLKGLWLDGPSFWRRGGSARLSRCSAGLIVPENGLARATYCALSLRAQQL
jgi:hypothetical protein